MVDLLKDCLGIIIGEVQLRSRHDAAGSARRRADDQQIRPHRADAIEDLLLGPGSDRQHGDHRRHPDDDSQHRQHRAKLVGHQALEGDFDDHPEKHHTTSGINCEFKTSCVFVANGGSTILPS